MANPTKAGTVSQICLKKDNVYYDVCDTKSREDMANLLNKIYPVGSIYMSMVNVSPQNFIGGTWTRIENTFLIAASNPSAQNKKYVVQTKEPFNIQGNVNGTVTLNVNQTPLRSHSHKMDHTHKVNINHTHGLNNHTHNIEAHTHNMNHWHKLKTRENKDNNFKGIHRARWENGPGIASPPYSTGLIDGGYYSDDWGRVIVSNIDSKTVLGEYPAVIEAGGPVISVWENGQNVIKSKTETGTNTNNKGKVTYGPNSSNTTGPSASEFTTGKPSSDATSNTGGANDSVNNTVTAVNIMPPYIAVYMWHRTA